jgi:hypothetical protein
MRYSSWGIGAGLGLVLVALAGLAVAIVGLRPDWRILAGLFGLGLGTVPVTEAAIDLLRLYRGDRLRERAEILRQREWAARLEQVPAPATVTVIRRIPHTVNGQRGELDLADTRPARWLAWQTASERTLAWYALRRSLTADALTPGCVADRGAWVALTDGLAAAGLIDKRPGQRTVWAHPLAVVRARIEAGACDWPADRDPPAVSAPPAPPGAAPVIIDGRAAERQNA